MNKATRGDKTTVHTTREGRQIKLSDMDDAHLRNTIRMLRRKAASGVVVWRGGMSIGDDEPWCDPDFAFGKEAYTVLRIPEYEKEAARRGLRDLDGAAEFRQLLEGAEDGL